MKTIRIILLFFSCLLPLLAHATETDGMWIDKAVEAVISNTEINPIDILYNNEQGKQTYTVYTAKGLAWIAKATNEGWKNDDSNDDTKQYYPAKTGFEDAIVQLKPNAGSKIDLSEHYWTPIGKYPNYFFKGTIDGNNCEVIGIKFYVDIADNSICLGFLGCISNAKVENLGVQIVNDWKFGTSSSGNSHNLAIGGIAGYLDITSSSATINNCYVYGDINMNGKDINLSVLNIGGIVGSNGNSNSFTTNCYSMVDINMNNNNTQYICIGSIIGSNFGIIESCYATGSIECNNSKSNAEILIGGITGRNGNQSIQNSFALNKKIKAISINSYIDCCAGSICGKKEGSGIVSDNYVSSSAKVQGENFFNDNADNGAIYDTSIKIQDILNGNNPSAPWDIDTESGLPYLTSFTGTDQPAKDNKNKYLGLPRLKLEDDLAISDVVNINYDNEDKLWYYFCSDGYKLFNGEISGELASHGIRIIGGTTINETLPLTITGEVNINANNHNNGLIIDNSVNLFIENGGKLNLNGENALSISSGATIYISQSESAKIKQDVNISFTGTDFGIQNNGTVKFQGKTLNCSIEGSNGFMNSSSTCEINEATVTVKSNNEFGCSIANWGAFSITNNGILNLIHSNKNKLIFSASNAQISITNGGTLIKSTDAHSIPVPRSLTYSSPSNVTLTVSDEDDVQYASNTKTNEGNELTIQATSTAKEIESFTFSYNGTSETKSVNPGKQVECTYTMPAYDLAISVNLKSEPVPAPDPEPDPDPNPIVYHTVTLPEVEGATTDPVAGNYEVESWDSFRFYLTLLPDYDASQPIVTTDRGDVLSPRTSDGAYVVKYVRSDIAISIDGIVKNPDPVANEIIREGLHISASDNRICIETDRNETAIIYNLMGQRVASFEVQPGMNYHWLAKGVYIVAVGDSRCKLSNY